MPIDLLSDNTQPSSGPRDLFAGVSPTPQPTQPMPQDQDVLQQAQTQPGVGPGTAAIAGLSNFGASTGESVADAGLWAANKLGLSDQTTDQAKVAVNQAANTFRTQANPNGNVFEKSLAQYPITGGAAQYVPAAMTIAKTALPDMTGSAIVNTALRAGANAVVGAGVSGPDKASQDQGAVVSAGLGVLGDVAVAGLNKAAKSLGLPEKIQQYVKPIYDKIKSASGLSIQDRAVAAEGAYTDAAIKQNNANYQVIKDLPGQIDNAPIQSKLINFAKSQGIKFSTDGGELRWDATNSTLEPSQAKILQTAWQDAGNMKNMEDAMQLRQYIAGNKSAFQGKQVSTDAYNKYTDLKTLVDGAIRQKAEAAGLGNAFDKANEINQNVVQPLYESGAVDRLSALNKKTSQEAFNAQQKPGQIQASVPPEYAQATKQIFTANMSPQQVKEVSSRLGPDGSQIMQDHFVQSTFKDIMANPENFEKNGALIKVNNVLDKYKDVLSPETIKTFQGVKTLLQEAGAIAKQEKPNGTYAIHYAGHVIGGAIGGAAGGYEGYQHGGGAGAAAGSIAGIVLGASAIQAIKKGLIDTPLGHRVLQSLANNPNKARELLMPLIQGTSANFNNMTESLKPSDNLSP